MLSLLAYAVGVVFVVLGLVFWRRGHTVRAHDVHGSLVAGEFSGTATFNNTRPAPDTEPAAGAARGDRVGWAIGIAGVVIAALQLAHDLLAK